MGADGSTGDRVGELTVTSSAERKGPVDATGGFTGISALFSEYHRGRRFCAYAQTPVVWRQT